MAFGKSALFACASVLLAGASSVTATDYTVTTSGFTFSPNVINAHPGDRVIFNVSFITHPTRSSPTQACGIDAVPFFNFTTGNQGTFTIPGNAPPQIPFNCGNHCSFGMTGVINITAVSPTGGCCTGTTCAVMTMSDCDTAEGSFLGADSGCLGAAGNPISCCPANFNQVDGVDVADLFGYINAWLAKDVAADFDHSTLVDVADLFGYINAWLAKC